MRNRTKEPGDGVRELKAKLAALEAERGRLGAAHSAARKAVGQYERALVTAEGDLAVAAATAASSSSWLDRRAERKAEAAVADIRAKLEEARAWAKEAEAALDPVEEEIIELRIGAVEPEIRAARKKAAELKALLRDQQEAALAIARQLAAVYQAARSKTPQRLVSMRSEKFLKVEITNPAITALYGAESPVNAERRRDIRVNAESEIAAIKAQIPFMNTKAAEDAKNKIAAIRAKVAADLEKMNPGSVFLHFEFFKARDGEKKGKWKIVPGQDLRPGKVERIEEDGPLPAEIESIRDIELGRLTTVNGRARTEQEKAELDFNFIERLVTEEELRQAARAIEDEEGV